MTPTTPTPYNGPTGWSGLLGTPITLPSFAPQAAGESLADYGRRAMRYALQLQAPIFAQLDDTALEAAGDACTHALTMRGHSDPTLACLTSLQRDLRSRLTARQADRAAGLLRLQAWLDAQGGGEVAPASDDAPQGPQGGSKVPRRPRPVLPTGPAGRVSPDETGQASSWAVPALPAASLADAF